MVGLLCDPVDSFPEIIVHCSLQERRYCWVWHQESRSIKSGESLRRRLQYVPDGKFAVVGGVTKAAEAETFSLTATGGQ